jgi:hypothetical protein
LTGVALVLEACNGLTGAADLHVGEPSGGTAANDAAADSSVAHGDASAADPRDAGGEASSSDAAVDADAGVGCQGAVSCARLVFVTSVEYPANLGGVAGADAKCQAHASKVSALAGRTFLAWIATSTTSPSARFTHGTQPYFLVDGEMIASSWTDLTDGNLQNGIRADENGVQAIASGAWTGTNSANGTYSGAACGDWTLVAPDMSGTRGNVGGIGAGWSSGGSDPCVAPHALYCFER